MPQPAVNDLTARRLLDVYDDAHEALIAEWRAAALEERRVRQTARLRDLLDTHEATMESLTATSRTWWSVEVPVLHAAGAAYSAEVVGSAFTWTQPHVAAVEEFAARTWADIAEGLRDVTAETRQAIRREIASATRSALLESRTAVQAGRDVAKAAAREGLWSVEYRNGARHTIRDYADSVVRTTTAEAYNRGSVTQARGDGYEYVEVFDGADCGWTSHQDPEKANGMIVAIDDVVYLSHPRCRRALVPAEKGRTLIDAATVDLGEAQAEVATIARREPRVPRVGRTGRG